MTLSSPEIQVKLAGWQEELRAMTGDKHIKIQAYQPIKAQQDIENIGRIVCEETQIDLELVRRRTRRRHIVLARHLIAYFARNWTRLSLIQIGNYLGGCDHTTIIHASNHIRDLLITEDPETTELVAAINNRLSVIEDENDLNNSMPVEE